MTTDNLNNLRLSLMYYHTQKADKLSGLIQINGERSLKNEEIVELNLLTGYIEMVMEYTLYKESEEDKNFLTRLQMKDLMDKLNQLLGTTYNYDFIKPE